MRTTDDDLCQLNELFDQYNIDKKDREIILRSIYVIFKHNEFQRRMTKEFPHHGNTPLGIHILQDVIVTYLLSKKYMAKHPKIEFNLDLALKIAMMHDLYTEPWQNNPHGKVKHFFNKHGFRHPIEAVINSCNWFPELFQDKCKAEVLIDGVVHHMYPLPVRRFEINDHNLLELRNFDDIKNIDNSILEILSKSSNRRKIGQVSLNKSLYIEGIIMSKADRIVSRENIKNIDSAIALVTGRNRSLSK